MGSKSRGRRGQGSLTQSWLSCCCSPAYSTHPAAGLIAVAVGDCYGVAGMCMLPGHRLN